MELLHNFTLVHDDIIDESPLRRGEETLHKKWDVPTAILAGDAMRTQAYTCLADSAPKTLRVLLALFMVLLKTGSLISLAMQMGGRGGLDTVVNGIAPRGQLI